MSRRRVSSFIDDMLANRRPRHFKASATDAEILRTAITMQAARPGEGAPDTEFVNSLRDELALQVASASAPRVSPMHSRPVSSLASRRSRLLVGAAAAVTVIGGTVAATTGVEHALVASGPTQTSYSHVLRTGTFESKDGKTVGEIVAYRGNPSWVFMSIKAPGLKGAVRCQIQMDNGHSGPTGVFVLQNGVGDWARPIPVDINQIHGATLTTSTGSTLATAKLQRNLTTEFARLGREELNLLVEPSWSEVPSASVLLYRLLSFWIVGAAGWLVLLFLRRDRGAVMITSPVLTESVTSRLRLGQTASGPPCCGARSLDQQKTRPRRILFGLMHSTSIK